MSCHCTLHVDARPLWTDGTSSSVIAPLGPWAVAAGMDPPAVWVEIVEPPLPGTDDRDTDEVSTAHANSKT